MPKSELIQMTIYQAFASFEGERTYPPLASLISISYSYKED
ncbi:hypothetical protein PCC7424_1771 [Gloeothece citriformis PCC 7424]|uniref:Uncharacterized protein n=1 Tax=Gloeothece citriformis (strain PCC 7424) TaxID=65393 RepID=B7KCA0_GLOC7|nr:hypothetical protein PCC7424_1771 [Gloeothece citriformis PCC 7424]